VLSDQSLEISGLVFLFHLPGDSSVKQAIKDFTNLFIFLEEFTYLFSLSYFIFGVCFYVLLLFR